MNSDLIQSLTALLVILAVIVVPIWLFLHYRERRLRMFPPPPPSVTAPEPAHDTRDLMTLALSLQQRVDSLERLLDAEAPGWRKRHD